MKTSSRPNRKTYGGSDVPLRFRKDLFPQSQRAEAAKCGGLGACGRCLCCSAWLKKPEELKIGMSLVRKQKITFDADNINGMCGKFKCCLAYEKPDQKQ